MGVASRIDVGKAQREPCSRVSHAGVTTHPQWPDPVELLIESSACRIDDLVPTRRGRRLAPPFAFGCGAASAW